MNDDSLVRRVLEAVPAGAYEMSALLSLLRVEASAEVETAAVSCEARPVLRVNPAFVERHCRSDEHLFVLVMHELHHVLLGHTRLFPRPTPAHNLAFDAVINSLLCARFPERAYTSFFLDYYGARRDALRLLAPPEGPALRDPVLRALHRVVYDQQATAEEVFRKVARELRVIPAGLLLGSHGDEGEWGTEGAVDPRAVEAIRAIVEKWPPPRDPVRGRSLNDLLRAGSLDPRTPAERVLAALRRALDGAARLPGRGPRLGPGPRPALVALPDPRDRRAGVARAAGSTPLLFASSLRAARGGEPRETEVYVDVSGSMAPYLPPLCGALRAAGDRVAPRVHLFSTRVVTRPLGDLAAGRYDSTGGTDLACVLQHALAQRVRRALVVTDGYVGRPPADLLGRARAAGLELRALLTPGGWRRDLQPLAARIDELPSLG